MAPHSLELIMRGYQSDALTCIQQHLKTNKKPAIASVATAGGKSIIIAKLCEWVVTGPNYNIIILTHRKELLEQNFSKITHDSVGLVSAGLKRKDYDKRIIVAGIQSVWKNAHLFKNVKLIIVDECQYLENNTKGNSMYWKFINQFPDARLIGFSATPFRLKDGALKWGRVVYHVGYKELLKLKFVTPLTNKLLYEPDLSKLRIQSGEFVISEMDKLYLEDEQIFKNAIEKIIGYGKDRKVWIGFVPSIKMAELVKGALLHHGIICEVVNSKTKRKDRKRILDQYKTGDIQCMVNVNVLTEGFDNPNIDLFFCFRPTLSLGLWHQMLGRTVRLSSMKNNALILDFSGNLKIHGSLMDESWKYKDGEIIMPPMENIKGRACPLCEEYVKVKDSMCVQCNYEFPVDTKVVNHKEEPDLKTDINKTEAIFKWANVTKVDYERNYKRKDGITVPMKVIYTCGFSQIYDFINSEHEAWDICQKGKPKRIKVNTATKWPKVMECDYGK